MAGLSLNDFDSIAGQSYQVQLTHARLHVTNYEEFVEALYNDIDWCVEDIQDSGKYLQPDVVGEDRVSVFLAASLRGMMYAAEAKFVKGGNTDLTVSSVNGQYKWIGEAKRVDSVDNTHIWGGFLQLVERYTSGDDVHAGILVYIYCENAKHVMDQYKSYTRKVDDYSFEYEVCKTRKAGGFYSTHQHTASGLDIKVRYIPVILYYDPKK